MLFLQFILYSLSLAGILKIEISGTVLEPCKFLKFILYSSSFAGTLKNEISGTALEPGKLKIKQLSPDILKFSTKAILLR